MKNFTYNVQYNKVRNEYDVSLTWGSKQQSYACKEIKQADQLRDSFIAHNKRIDHSAQVVAAGRLD